MVFFLWGGKLWYIRLWEFILSGRYEWTLNTIFVNFGWMKDLTINTWCLVMYLIISVMEFRQKRYQQKKSTVIPVSVTLCMLTTQMSYCYTGKGGTDCSQNICCIHGITTYDISFFFQLCITNEWRMKYCPQRIFLIWNVFIIQGHCLWHCVNIWKIQLLKLLENAYSALRVMFHFELEVSGPHYSSV